MNIVRNKTTKEIISAGFCDFTGQFDANIYEQVSVNADSADVKYKKFDAEDKLIDMTEVEKLVVDNAEKKKRLKSEIIDLQMQIDACDNLLTNTIVDVASITSKKNELIGIRDGKITEYNAL